MGAISLDQGLHCGTSVSDFTIKICFSKHEAQALAFVCRHHLPSARTFKLVLFRSIIRLLYIGFSRVVYVRNLMHLFLIQRFVVIEFQASCANLGCSLSSKACEAVFNACLTTAINIMPWLAWSRLLTCATCPFCGLAH